MNESGWSQRSDCYRLMLDAGADPSLLFFSSDFGGSFLISSFSMELWFGPLVSLLFHSETSNDTHTQLRRPSEH